MTAFDEPRTYQVCIICYYSVVFPDGHTDGRYKAMYRFSEGHSLKQALAKSKAHLKGDVKRHHPEGSQIIRPEFWYNSSNYAPVQELV